MVVTFGAGYIAGVFCAVVSHPADTLVSKLNQAKGASVGDIVKKIGFMGECLKFEITHNSCFVQCMYVFYTKWFFTAHAYYLNCFAYV